MNSPTSRVADERLKACPFCGGNAEHDTDDLGCHGIRCMDCSIYLGAYSTQRRACEVWNRRAAESADEYGPLAYIAASLNAQNSTVPRWWCLREESRAESLKLAQRIVDAWAAGERSTAEKYRREDAAIARQAGGEGE